MHHHAGAMRSTLIIIHALVLMESFPRDILLAAIDLELLKRSTDDLEFTGVFLREIL